MCKNTTIRCAEVELPGIPEVATSSGSLIDQIVPTTCVHQPIANGQARRVRLKRYFTVAELVKTQFFCNGLCHGRRRIFIILEVEAFLAAYG
jgi:hypothetical protein